MWEGEHQQPNKVSLQPTRLAVALPPEKIPAQTESVWLSGRLAVDHYNTCLLFNIHTLTHYII